MEPSANNNGWEALKHNLQVLCPTGKHSWPEHTMNVFFSSGSELVIEMERNGKYNWPYNQKQKTKPALCLRLDGSRAQYFINQQAAYESLAKKKKKFGDIESISTSSERDIYDGDVYERGTFKTLYGNDNDDSDSDDSKMSLDDFYNQ